MLEGGLGKEERLNGSLVDRCVGGTRHVVVIACTSWLNASEGTRKKIRPGVEPRLRHGSLFLQLIVNHDLFARAA